MPHLPVPPNQVIMRVAELANEDPTNKAARTLALTCRAFARAARPAMMKTTTVYVQETGDALQGPTQWMKHNVLYANMVHNLVIATRGAATGDCCLDSNPVAAADITALCLALGEVRVLTLRGLNIAPHLPQSPRAPLGPASIHTLEIVDSHADITLLAVASTATRLPGLVTLQIDGYGGEVMPSDVENLRTTMRRSQLTLDVIRVRRCSVDQIQGINVILRASAPTLTHFNIELWPTPEPQFEIAGSPAIDLRDLQKLVELDVFVPIRLDGGWYDIRAHADPIIRMARLLPPSVTTTHIVLWNRMLSVDDYISALALFPIQSMCAYFKRVPAMELLYIRAGSSDISPSERAIRWRRINRASKAWRRVCLKYGRFLKLD